MRVKFFIAVLIVFLVLFVILRLQPRPVDITPSDIQFSTAFGILANENLEDYAKRIALEEVEIAEELDLDYAELYLPYSAYVDNDTERLGFYDEIVAALKKENIKIVIADGGNVPNPLSWEEFKEWHKTFLREATKRHKPYAVVVAMDPWFPWNKEQTAISDADSVTPEMVKEHISDCITEIRDVDPDVRVVLGNIKGDVNQGYPFKNPDPYEVVQEAVDEVDVYGTWSYGMEMLREQETFVHEAKDKGKDVWVLGSALGPLSWRTPFTQPWRSLYIEESVEWSKEHASYYAYMFTVEFISYDEVYLKTSEDLSQRTATYETYKRVIEETRD